MNVKQQPTKVKSWTKEKFVENPTKIHETANKVAAVLRASVQRRGGIDQQNHGIVGRTIQSQGAQPKGRKRLLGRDNINASLTNQVSTRRIRNAPSSSALKKYVDDKGSVIAVSRLFTSREDYQRAVPLTSGSVWSGSHADELMEVKSDGLHNTIRGREFLGSVKVTYNNAATPLYGMDSIGDRLFACPVAPGSFGGRPELLAQSFEQHRIKTLWLEYDPVVPATQPGAIALAFRNDLSVVDLEVGQSSMIHASTLEYFLELPVWQNGRLEIRPGDIMKRYYDENSGDFAFEAQGMLLVYAASEFDTSTASITLGNLFVSYEFDFSSPSLDQTIDDLATGTVRLIFNNTTSVTDGEPVRFSSAAGALPTWNSTLTNDELLSSVAYGVIESASDVGSVGNPVFSVMDSVTTSRFLPGQGFYGRFAVITTSGAVGLWLFGSLGAAQNFDASSEDRTEGQLVWAQTLGVGSVFSFTIIASVRLWSTEAF